MDKDKIILVVYAGMLGLGSTTVYDNIMAIQESLKYTFDDSVKTLIVPRRDSDETWVECINPQLVTEEKYKEAEEAVEKIKKKLEEMK